MSMPTVHREGPFSFRIWPADHDPPHVHVYNSDGMCIVEIETAVIRKRVGMQDRDAARAAAIVKERSGSLLEAWRKIHG